MSDSEAQGLQRLGVTRAVSAGQLEQALLEQAQQHCAVPTALPTGVAADPATLRQQLRAVQRELRTVQAAVDALREHQEEAEAADGGDGEAASGAPTAAGGGGLQQAVMQRRLEGLQAQQGQLEQALLALGALPDDAAAAAAGGSSQQRGGPSGAAHPTHSSAKVAARSGKGGKKRQKVQFEEDDLFGEDAGEEGAGAAGGLLETERDRLIRLGVLTPFDRLDGFERRVQRGPQQHAGTAAPATAAAESEAAGSGASGTAAAREERQAASIARMAAQMRDAKATRPTTRLLDASELPRQERSVRRVEEAFWRQAASGRAAPVKKKARARTLERRRLKRPHRAGRGAGDISGSESGSGSEEEEEDGEGGVDDAAAADEPLAAASSEDLSGEFDDADEEMYQQRQQSYLRRRAATAAPRSRLRRAGHAGDGGPGAEGERGGSRDGEGEGPVAAGEEGQEEEGEEEEQEDVVFEGGFRLPAELYVRLFDYQQTGVKWLWELHTQRAGGIIGDEMGLGKTIQVIAFLAGLHHSGLFRRSIIVCPATVLRQWLRELRAWWPLFRVALLHDSARSAGGPRGTRPSRSDLVAEIAGSEAGVLLTTYETMRVHRAELLGVEWGYVVLDEGHKIRNPDAEVTLAAKQMQTVHRLIMTGSPIQNRLTELWSLFDFVFPGKLGTLPVFTAQFALPIQVGGYANASPTQVATAYKYAVVLRDLIAPYLLRRRKADVNAQLPAKTEHVLFCSLTQEQRDMYKAYLASKELGQILQGDRTALAGIDILRKICNHPDLLERTKWEAAEDYGNPARSGKMLVLAKLMEHWHEAGHKALVFTQTQQMLDILERHVQRQGYTYHRMDGGTSIAMRARLIDDFNDNPRVFCFLLTTRVGGLGVNLTGANRVVLCDPDWNPSTDVQARERAWRIGQKREVAIYRLITGGTIEEKVYHRQVYKHFLTDRILRDPRQRRFFKAKDLSDLFTLGDEYAEGNETASIFASLGTEVLPDAPPGEEEQEGAAAAEGEGGGQGAGRASDRDDYASDGEGRQQQQEQGTSTRAGWRLGRTVAAAPAAQQQQGAMEGAGEERGDARILRELFDGSGVQSAIDHSKVEGANDSSRIAADQEAARVAGRAAEALRQSRLACQRAPINQPTWTGRSGGAGAPAQPRFGRALNPALQQQQQVPAVAPPRFGSGGLAGSAGGGSAPRSADILARVRERAAATAAAAASAAVMDPAVERAQALAGQIAAFLEAQGGFAASDVVVGHFQGSVGAEQLALFRGVLKQVAQLQRRAGAKGWALRPEFGSEGGG